MAIRMIVREGDEILRKKSRPVERFDKRLHQLLDDMVETLAQANGAGLAAPQVGILRRVVVMDVGEGVIEMVNPELVEAVGEQDGPEGCLSSPGEWGQVKRPLQVIARALDRNGQVIQVEGEGLLARCICHEIDHLDGVLFKDKASRMLDESEVE